MTKYPDGSSVSKNLPESYQSADSIHVPPGQECSNCRHYRNEYCYRWSASVKQTYWCYFWTPSKE